MIDTERLRTLADRDRSMTHWVGCEYDHIGCAITAACREIEALRSINGDLSSKVQFLVDHWPHTLEDGGITFPDGDFWPATKSKGCDHGE